MHDQLFCNFFFLDESIVSLLLLGVCNKFAFWSRAFAHGYNEQLKHHVPRRIVYTTIPHTSLNIFYHTVHYFFYVYQLSVHSAFLHKISKHDNKQHCLANTHHIHILQNPLFCLPQTIYTPSCRSSPLIYIHTQSNSAARTPPKCSAAPLEIAK